MVPAYLIIVLNMFHNAHMDARTDAFTYEQDKTIMPPAALCWVEG